MTLLSIIQSPLFIANLLIGIFFLEYALYKTRAVRKVDEERDSKYSAFRRYDVKHWKRWRLYFGTPFLFPRMILAILHLLGLYLVIRVVNFNMTATRPPSQLQIKITIFLSKCFKRSEMLVAGGVIWVSKKKVDYDYKKYLGPEWKPTSRTPSTIVSNHSGWLDILLGCAYFDFPIYTSKVGIKNWVMVGTLVTYPGYQAIFLDRAGTKEEREKIVNDIVEKQREI